tara:strand:- start:1925 stop:2800 length:876 start_codon:yes stop_codon:yes gene_type:complete
MKVLITGADGQVGQHLVMLLSSQFEVIACNKKQCDITDWDSVIQVFEKCCPNVVINAAAYTAVDLAEEQSDLAYLVNEKGAMNLAKSASLFGALMVHISTDYVFSGELPDLYRETNETGPQGVYGSSKLAGEQAVLQYHDKSIVIRTSWVFSEFGNNFLKTMLKAGRQREELGIVADQFGGPTYAGDIAKLIQKIITQQQEGKPIEFGVYHYCGLPYVSWYQFAEDIFERSKVQRVFDKIPVLHALTTKQYPTKAVRPKNSRLDCTKVCQNFQVQPSDWKKSLANLKNYSE